MPSNPQNILIAEDDVDDLELFQSALTEVCPGLKMTVATNGQKLLNMLEVEPKPGVILLDLNMPFVSGKECLKEIRKKQAFNDVPIVIYSTSSQPAEINYCLTNGANEYYIKPNSYSGIVDIVHDFYDTYLSGVKA